MGGRGPCWWSVAVWPRGPRGDAVPSTRWRSRGWPAGWRPWSPGRSGALRGQYAGRPDRPGAAVPRRPGIERQQLRWVAAGAAARSSPGAGGWRERPSSRCALADWRRCACRWRWRWRCCATGSGTWTAWSAAPSPTRWSLPCWCALPAHPPAVTAWPATSGSLAVAGATLAAAAAFARYAAGSRTWSTGGSTAPATTPPAPWRGSQPGCATKSTWRPFEGELLGVVDETVQPTRASLWLRPHRRPRGCRGSAATDRSGDAGPSLTPFRTGRREALTPPASNRLTPS